MASKTPVSKYKHTYGTPAQATDHLYGLIAGACSQDSNVLQTNGAYLAFPCKVPGTVAIVPIGTKGQLPEDTPILEHEEQVNEIAFSPFKDNLVITACQDTIARIWTIPQTGLEQSTSAPTAALVGNAKRLISAGFHPLASGVAITTSVDEVRLWDVENQMSMVTLPPVHKGMLTSLTWDYFGRTFATSCKDKALRVFDPRSNTMIHQVDDHQGTKGGRAQWCGKQDLILTVGFNKQTDREIALWDVRSMKERVQTLKIDLSPSSPMPFYDDDTNLLFLGGKGDSSIRVYEVNGANDAPVTLLSEMKHTLPASGMAMLPKSTCDVMKVEVANILKLCPSGQLVPIRFATQRQNTQFFHDDLFPDTWDHQATGTAASWFQGEDHAPVVRSMDPSKQ
ncbi:hypothetical protein SAMD00019534_018420 [Acytostelium subglobosum LB1]|uniref:hypothetical protein n=1 Tax=Acytostelium subglobosum LB1 TaxID=1410327 RepID=UPI000644FD8F|nr:hypothetical protein SAMD00019534_018420 [Acytostelium subglobosum LB1]GAM18667.1 hypothetical protein SAMD00019534_018420 [Acytostelium subglobosum LB1]|eukprot:XP_012757887.1 hypothetical protein SAMD00019534_018420 [Acytostelium subglobosum LB1]